MIEYNRTVRLVLTSISSNCCTVHCKRELNFRAEPLLYEIKKAPNTLAAGNFDWMEMQSNTSEYTRM